MSDLDDIRAVLVRYCQHCDDGAFDDFALLFTDDATFSVMGKVHRGRDEIKAFMAGAQPPEARGKHIISEPLIAIDGDVATVSTDYAFIGRAGKGLAVTSTGRYVDRFTRDPTGWKIAAREIVFLGD